MPDLTLKNFYHCDTLKGWSKKIDGSGGKQYVVSFGFRPNGRYQYDFSCTCSSFKFRNKHCKHIHSVIESDSCCRWQQAYEGGSPVVIDGDKRCPNCNGPVSVETHGV